MTRRVARAIGLAMQFKDFGHFNADGEYECTGEQIDQFQRACDDAADAAIKAMRDLTEPMQKVGFLANVWTNPSACDRPGCVGRVTMPFDKAWKAAIDAALDSPKAQREDEC